MPAVNPDIMTWARERAGMSLEQAASAIGIKDARGRTGAERLAAIEAGSEEPSQRQLLNMAQKYRRSLLIFYLKAPPRQGDRGQDFRTVPGAQPSTYDATLDALIRDVKSRQNLVRSVLEDEDAGHVPIVGSATHMDNPQGLAARIRQSLSFDLAIYRRQKTIDDAFAYLRACIEEVGIFVLLAGNLGSHHSNISTETFRGFAIADPIAPFIVINDQDARASWSFTALHEATHIWLGTTGVSGYEPNTQIERFCNDVAGEVLLPAGDLRDLASAAALPFNDLVQRISDFADERKVSRAMIAYKLNRSGMIDDQQWRELTRRFRADWLAAKSRTREGDNGGPNYYVIRRHRLGPALLNLMTRALGEGVITPTKAAHVLGVKPRSVDRLLRGVPPQGVA